MLCAVSRHYPYTVTQAMQLTPRQVYRLVLTCFEEKAEMFELIGKALGAKTKGPASNQDGLKMADFDTVKIDEMSQRHLDRLKAQRAKQ